MGLRHRIIRILPDIKVLNDLLSYGNALIRLRYMPNFVKPSTFNEIILQQRFSKKFDVSRAGRLTCKVKFKEEIKKKYPSLVVPTLYCSSDVPDITRFLLGCRQRVIVKPSHSSGKYLVVDDPNTLNPSLTNKMFKKWLAEDYFIRSREPNYKGLEPSIIIEPLLQDAYGVPPKDFKVFVYNGVAKAIQVDHGRFGNHTRQIYDRRWELQSFSMMYERNKTAIDCPSQLKEMLSVSEDVAKNFQFVRVDFYAEDHFLYLGEMTFFPGNGAEQFMPAIGDRLLGQLLLDD